jgi:outer membrane protein assembly factor BamA
MNLSKLILIGILVLLQTDSLQAGECSRWSSDFSKRTGLRVGHIKIKANNIFDLSDKKESKLIHRATNKLHMKTRNRVIRNQLLFQRGDKFQVRKLAETARILRSQRYLKSAQVIPVELCGNEVNISVETSDNWTLTPGLTFGRSGGNNKSGIDLQEHNLLGFGKSLSLSYKQGVERNSQLLSYQDSQLFGTRKKLSLSLQNNTDGKGYAFDLSKPFYEFESKEAWGLSTSKLEQQTSIYEAGEVINKITEEKTLNSLFYGWSKDGKKDSVTRFSVGWTFDKTNYLRSSQTQLPNKTDLVESYPWIEFKQLEENYITKTNFKTMGKIEDVLIGKTLSVGAGVLRKELGSDENHLKLSAGFSNGYILGKSNLGFIDLEGTSYLGDGSRQGESILIKGELDHFKQQKNDLYFSGTLQLSNNLKLAEQLNLGGETGLRGYPKAYQTGNKTALLQAEKRFHFDWYPLHLAKFGAVVFSDFGTAWGEGNDSKLLADIGIGLRVISTQSSSAKALHLDLAFPLVDRDKVDSFQFLIKTSKDF